MEFLARGVDADRHVRGADGPCSDDHGRPARQLAVRLGHERRAALVAGTHHADAFVDERLEERQEALTGDREGKPHAGGAQLACQERRHGHGWRVHFGWRDDRRRCLVGGCDRRGLGGFDVRGRRARCVSLWRLGQVRVARRRIGVGVGRLGHVRLAGRRMGVGLWRLGHVRVGSRRRGVGVLRHRRGIVGERCRHGAVVPDRLRRLGGARQRLVARERPVGIHCVDSRLVGVVRSVEPRHFVGCHSFGCFAGSGDGVGRRGVVERGDVGGSCCGVGRRRVVGR